MGVLGGLGGLDPPSPRPQFQPYQLFTWRIVSPVSCASCFFCSSEG